MKYLRNEIYDEFDILLFMKDLRNSEGIQSINILFYQMFYFLQLVYWMKYCNDII